MCDTEVHSNGSRWTRRVVRRPTTPLSEWSAPKSDQRSTRKRSRV